jgi:hypothetical protein
LVKADGSAIAATSMAAIDKDKMISAWCRMVPVVAQP